MFSKVLVHTDTVVSTDNTLRLKCDWVQHVSV